MRGNVGNQGSASRAKTLAELQKQRDEALDVLPASGFQNARMFQPVQALPASVGMFDHCASTDWDAPKMFNDPFPQTTLNDCLSGTSPLTNTGKVVVKNTSQHLGKLTLNGETLGTAVVLNKDYIIVSRHCIEGRFVDKMALTLGKHQIKCDYVVEEDAKLDYAVIKISGIPSIPTLKFATNSPDSTLLFHYPLDGELVVSGHVKTIENTGHSRADDLMSVCHDSDSGSCGGAYVDETGKIVAFHLGVDIDDDGYSMSASMGTGSAERYTISINSIWNKKRDSVLFNLENSRWQPEFQSKYLPLANPEASWTREGYQSQLKFTQLLKASSVDLSTHAAQAAAGVTVTKSTKVVSFQNAATVIDIKTKYPAVMAATITSSLGQAGLHKHTNQYSIAGEIESDHPIPYDVWATTSNPKLKSIVNTAIAAKKTPPKSRERPGEDNMPAITIPFSIHQPTNGIPNIKTTGSHQIAKDFRKQLKDKCDLGDIPGAIEDVIQDYKDNNLLGATAIDPKYTAAWVAALDQYEALGVITPGEKAALVTKL